MITPEQKIQALLKAKYKMENRQTMFLCYALPFDEAGGEVRAYIQSRFAGYETYDEYLKETKPEYYEQHKDNPIVFRLDWVDSLIEMYDAEVHGIDR